MSTLASLSLLLLPPSSLSGSRTSLFLLFLLFGRPTSFAENIHTAIPIPDCVCLTLSMKTSSLVLACFFFCGRVSAQGFFGGGVGPEITATSNTSSSATESTSSATPSVTIVQSVPDSALNETDPSPSESSLTVFSTGIPSSSLATGSSLPTSVISDGDSSSSQFQTTFSNSDANNATSSSGIAAAQTQTSSSNIVHPKTQLIAGLTVGVSLIIGFLVFLVVYALRARANSAERYGRRDTLDPEMGTTTTGADYGPGSILALQVSPFDADAQELVRYTAPSSLSSSSSSDSGSTAELLFPEKRGKGYGNARALKTVRGELADADADADGEAPPPEYTPSSSEHLNANAGRHVRSRESAAMTSETRTSTGTSLAGALP
ncbi:hypothetical protein HMN09_01111900 [Mycena chlorophos]|uniref:Mid2 domain-containing protein n=1 Tax=Mycena chlorophos TaxID=658473 RepID=A0A8H6VYF8_MYCCL|nr:hypothetical protein HMN09_01111900 [Mycena chlorophos]